MFVLCFASVCRFRICSRFVVCVELRLSLEFRVSSGFFGLFKVLVFA